MSVLSALGHVFTLIGGFFLLTSGIGIVRMPDVWNRMHAGTKTTTLGSLSFLFGLGLMRPEWMPKLLLIALAIGLTNPVSSHALARAIHRVPGEKPDNLLRDDLEGKKEE